jgi:hypothetical protein
MPEQVERCVDSVLEENPDYPESRAWAICNAQFEAEVEEIPEVHRLGETDLMAEGLDQLCEKRPGEWVRVESESAVAWIGRQTGATIYTETESEERPGGYAYPDAGGEDALPEVREAVERFRDDPDEDTPLLYHILGSGTDPYKMAKVDAEYQDEPNEGETCANCEYAYQGADGTWICSQVAGEIEPEAWCRLFEAVDLPESREEAMAMGWSPTALVSQQAVTVDGVALEFPPGGEVIDHEEGDWSEFLDDLDTHGDVFQVYSGLKVHPDDALESHDAPTYVSLDADKDVTAIEEVLTDHPAVDYTINAGSVDSFDQPDGWDPSDPEKRYLYHGVNDAEQQAVAVYGLSQEAREAIEERYNVSVVGYGSQTTGNS